MDNNNYEQQFSQNVKSTMPAPAPIAVGGESSKLPLIVAAILGVVTLVESIILIVTLINFFQLANPGEEDVITSEDTYLDIGEDGTSGYDDDGNLVWLNLTCTNSESGDKYTLTESGSYQFSGSSQTGSGEYTIVNDSLISLTGASGNKVLFYDGYSIADELTLYDCDFDIEEPAETEE